LGEANAVSMSFLRFYREVARRAVSGRFWFAEKIAGGFALFFGAAAWYLASKDMEAAVNWLPFIVFAAVLAGTLSIGLIVAPWRIYREEAEGRVIAEKRLRPSLVLGLPSRMGQDINFGTTLESLTGHRQTNLRGRENVLQVSCTNTSALRVVKCKATLLDVRRVEADGSLSDVGFRESIALSWSRDIKSKEFLADIEPGEARAIYILAAKPNETLVIYRDNDIPIEYHQILRETAVYRLWIGVNGEYDAKAQIAVDARSVPSPKGAFVGACAVESELVNPLQPRPTEADAGPPR